MDDPRSVVGPFPASALLVVIAGIGAALRIRQYLVARSLWLDEAMVGVNIVRRTPLELLVDPLELNQVAPAAFLEATALLEALFGGDPQVLRLVPLAMSLIGVVLAVVVAREAITSAPGQVVFVGICTLAPVLVYYSSELKQFGGDVTATLALLWALERRHDGIGVPRLAVVGLAVPWISHPSVLVLAGGFAVLLLDARDDRAWRRPVAWLAGVWTANGLLLAVQLSSTRSSDAVRAVWHEGYAPSPLSLDGLDWYRETALGLVYLVFRHREIAPQKSRPEWFDIGTYALLAVIVAAVVVVVVRGHGRRLVLVAVTGAGAVTLAAVELYPLRGRLMLYLIPLVALTVALAIDVVDEIFPRGAVVIVAALLAVVAVPSARVFLDPHDRFDIEWAFEIVEERIEDGDVILLGPSSGPAWEFYRDTYPFEGTIVRRVHDYDVDNVLERWAGVRVWFVASHPVGDAPELLAAMLARDEVVAGWDGDAVYVRLIAEDNVDKS